MNGEVTSFNLAQALGKAALCRPIYLSYPLKFLLKLSGRKKEIGGIEINGTDFKLSQFSDDTTLILDGAKESFLESLLLLDAFGNISGLKLNYNKTEALWIGSMTDCKHKLCPEEKIKWPKKKVKALGCDSQLTQILQPL